MDDKVIARELIRCAKDLTANAGRISVSKGLLDFIYSPFSSELEIGIGGEWWGGKVKLGQNIYRHRKERVDEAYKPVTVSVMSQGQVLVFDIMGGFLSQNMVVYVSAGTSK